MGLELVELGIRVEEEFNVYIADEDYEAIKTVGDLEMYIAGHTTNVWPCPHIPAFSKLRTGLARITNCSEDEIDLNTPLAKFSGPIERTAFWKRLADETKLKLPALQTPAIFITIDFLFCMVGFCCISLIVSFAVYTVPAPHISFCLALLLISFLCMHFSNSLLGKLLKFCSEKYSWAALVFSTPTIRELTKSVASMNRSQLVTPTSKHYEEIWPRLVEIVSDTLVIAPDEIVPEARFIEDLSCG